MPGDAVNIELSKDEALVLFEWLSKQVRTDRRCDISPLEQFALDCLLCTFEKVLVEPFDTHYSTILKDAQKRVSARGGLELSI